MRCHKEHESIKADDHSWSSLAYVGVQFTPADEYGPDELLELRNCQCGSTLAKAISTKSEVLP